MLALMVFLMNFEDLVEECLLSSYFRFSGDTCGSLIKLSGYPGTYPILTVSENMYHVSCNYLMISICLLSNEAFALKKSLC